MKKGDKNTEAFFALLRAGLWGQSVRLSAYGPIDYSAIQVLAEEQSVVGLIAAGLEHVEDAEPAKQDVSELIDQAMQLEQQNSAMNYFIGVMIDKMRAADIFALLVKGQGIAQCYERPLWRSCGDVDFFLSGENYEKAKAFLIPLATSVEDEYVREKHLGMTVDPWVLELHGSLYSGLSSRIEKELDDVYQDSFSRGNVRYWNNDQVQVPLLSVENDAFYVFTHILQHFYKSGIGLRQICDWCRLLWTYRDELDLRLVKTRIRRAGLLSEWRAFGAFAVDYLGMPPEAMPLYAPDNKWKRKADNICSFILEVGNFGHNTDRSYFGKYPYVIRKAISMSRRIGYLFRHARIFPLDSVRFLPRILINGVRSAMRGE